MLLTWVYIRASSYRGWVRGPRCHAAHACVASTARAAGMVLARGMGYLFIKSDCVSFVSISFFNQQQYSCPSVSYYGINIGTLREIKTNKVSTLLPPCLNHSGLISVVIAGYYTSFYFEVWNYSQIHMEM